MRYYLFSLICAIALFSCESEDAVKESSCIACWYDVNHQRYALALDLSFGDYQPSGQVSFTTMLEVRKALKRVGSKLIILNGCPQGELGGHCRTLNSIEITELLKNNEDWKIIEN